MMLDVLFMNDFLPVGFLFCVVEFLLLFNEFARYWMLVSGFVVRNLAGFG